MKLPDWNMLLFCLIALFPPWVAGASAAAEPGPSLCAAQPQMRSSLPGEGPENFPAILAAASRDQCFGGCNSGRQACVDRCPGLDESNVVDPKYASRKCKAACDEVLSQCKIACPND